MNKFASARDQGIILVVEDEPYDQVLIEKAFREVGVTNPIHIVADGLEAIAYMMGEGKYADRNQFPYPTLITTDLKMPGADGFAVLEHLNANPDWKVIPIVVLSASEDPDDIRTAYLLGANSYHVKPAAFLDLCKQLRILYDYWMTCKLPEVDSSGRQVRTSSTGRLGERYPQAHAPAQRRAGKWPGAD